MKLLKYILISGNIFLLACGSYMVYHTDTSVAVQLILTGILVSLCLMNVGSYLYFRGQFIALTSQICHCCEHIMRGNSYGKLWNRETLTSKIIMELEKMERVTLYQISESRQEKKELQEMISEITHQIKTPLSNIKMYCEMFSDTDICDGQSKQFMDIMKSQLMKAEFLLDALVKASRLETEMIIPEPSYSKIIDTLVIAVNNMIHKADQKHISLSVDCRSSVQVYHDTKWTAEAIENVLDNAVKYSSENSKINISVHVGEMYTEINIKDTGKGIEPAHINDIFKRFYREKSVSKIEGLGLGLYLARKIITLQKGYISVHSAVGKGSCFSICLPNHMS